MKQLLLLLCFCFVSRLEATTFYVATTGSDANSCTTAQTIGTPKLTINSGAACLVAGNGDTLLIRGGTYVENLNGANFPAGTNYTNAATISGYQAETVINKPASGRSGAQSLQLDSSQWSYIKIEKITLDADYPNIQPTIAGTPTVKLGNGSHHIRFTNVEVKNCDSSCILTVGGGDSSTFFEFINCVVHNASLNGAYGPGGNCLYISTSDNLVDGGEVYDNTRGSGVRTWSSDSGAFGNRNTVRNVKIHNCNSGISVADANNVFYNNLLYSNACAIQIGRYKATPGTRIYNNTLSGNTLGSSNASGIEFLTPSNLSNTEVRNNIFASGSSPQINSGTTAIFSNNLCDVSGTGCGVVAAPLFVNAPTDLSVLTGSPAIDAGVSLAATFTTDFAGITRPQGGAWDIGAYEKTDAAGPTLTLLNPNGGTLGVVSSAQTFTWGFTDAASVPNVKLSYDAANDGTFETVISASTPNDGSFAFTAAAVATTTGRFKVEDAADGSPSDTSDANVTITAAAGGSFTKIISNNTTGSNPGDISGVSDTFIWLLNPTLNYATNTTLQPNKFDATDHSHVLIKFDGLSQIPSTATVTSVTLGLYLSDASIATAETIDIRRLLQPWNVAQATWNSYSTGNAWNTAGGLGAATDRVSATSSTLTGVTATPGWFSVTVTSAAAGTLLDDVTKIVNGTYTNLGWHLERNGTGNDSAYRVFDSSDGTNGQRPYLGLIYTTGVASLTVTQPTATSHVFPGNSMPIRWTAAGFTGNVQVDISYNNGVSYQSTPIITSIPYDQPDGVWTVAGPACTQCKIKVTSLTDTAIFAESPAFKIAGTYLVIR